MPFKQWSFSEKIEEYSGVVKELDFNTLTQEQIQSGLYGRSFHLIINPKITNLVIPE
jgi:hypothetical protein